MADKTIPYTAEMVGSGHPTKSDTLNNLALVEHNTDGTHKYHDPWLVDIMPQPAPLTATGWASGRSVDYMFNGYLASDGTQNREVTWPVVLSAGEWTVRLMHGMGPNRGKYHVYFGTTSMGTIDGFCGTGSAVNDVTNDIASCVVSPPGKYTLKIKMATANASATSYVGALQHIRLMRTT